MLEGSPEPYQRVGFLVRLPKLLKDMGLDPAGVIASAGLGQDALDDPTALIPFRKSAHLIQLAAEKTDTVHFGLELGRTINHTTLGLPGQLMRNAPTLGAGLRIFARNQQLNSTGAAIYLIEEEDCAFFGYAVYVPDVRGVDTMSDAAALAMFTVINELVRLPKNALEVLLCRSRPKDSTPYIKAFGRNLRFESEQTAVMLPRALLNKPINLADPTLFEGLNLRVRQLRQERSSNFGEELRRGMREALLTGQSSASDVSKQLGMNTRMLHRRLLEAGLRFQDALNEARCEFVKQLLANTGLSIATISNIVGYSDPSILTRSFTRWTGMNPTEWKRKSGTGRN